MINENSEVRDEQRIITPAISTINQTIEQIAQNWKQISFPGLDRLSLQTKFLNPTSIHSAITQQSLHRTPTIPTSNSMVSSVTSNGLTLSMNFNNIKTEKSSYDNLTHSIPQFFNQISHPHLLDDGYDNISIATNSPLDSSEQVVQPKRWQSIHLIFPFTLQMTTNQINHQRKNSSKYTFTHQQTSPSSTTNILRHISTPSLELYPNHAQAETMN